jgi:uncharacterized protein (DUF433 family)
VKLWSYADLMGLRTISWLRRSKESPEGVEVPASSMPAVRRALESLRELDSTLWHEDVAPSVAVDRGGNIVTNPRSLPEASWRQQLADEKMLDLLYPFPGQAGSQGPDLRTPRPMLRIVPGKLSGSPHIARSRIETQALAALALRGMGPGKIVRLYPFLSEPAISEALDLEQQLTQNIRALAA